MAVIRISANTNMLIITKSILSQLHRHQYAEVQALGYFSVRRTEAAIVRAATILEMENLKLVYSHRLIEPDTDGNEKAGIRFFLSVVEEPSSQPGPEGSFERVPIGPLEKQSLSGFTRSASKKEADTAGTGGSANPPRQAI